MSMTEFFWSAWEWDPSVLAGCALLMSAYLWATDRRFSLRTLSYTTGVLILALALTSPLDPLSDTYLFSAHMFQHLLLILIVPPLLLLGLPPVVVEQILRRPYAARVEKTLSSPLTAWTLGIGTLWLWHWPPLYNLALAHEPIHVFEHLTFLVTATVFWWPIMAPLESLRMRPVIAIFYLFTAMAANSILGIILAVAKPGWYPAYLHPDDEYGILPALRQQWGLTPEADQQLGGIIMWIPGGAVFLAALIPTMARWFHESAEEEDHPAF